VCDQENEVIVQGAQVPYPKALARFPTVRQSLLASFDACALETRFETEYRRGWSEHHQGRGRLFHKVAANCLREMHKLGEGKIPVDLALAILDEVIAQDDADSECPDCGSEKILPGLTRFMERTCGDCGALFETEFVNVPRRHIAELVMVTKKWAYDNDFDIDHLIDIEKRLQAPVTYSLRGLSVERMLTGQLDALFIDPQDPGHAIVLDWKDTWGLPPKSQVSEEGFFQQRFYAWLVMRTYRRIDRVTLREFYVRRSVPREATMWRHDLDQLDAEWAALVRKFDRAYEQSVYVPSPGRHCGWCPRPGKCPIPVDVRGEGAITTEKRAKAVAATLTVAKSTVRKAETSLKAWVKDNGPVEIKDAKGKRVYGFVTQERVDRPSEDEIEEAILKNGGSLTGEQMRALYKPSTGTRFTDHAPPERDEGEDKGLIDSLAASLKRASERKGI
jgi:hypothetical protein